MKFRLLEDLEDDLINKNNRRKEIINIIRNSLTEQGFKENEELNGVAFNKDVEISDTIFYCEFYLDLDNNKYKSYVSNDSDNKVMFTQEGDIDDATKALEIFIDFLNSI